MTKTPDKLSCILEKFHNKAIDIQKLSFEEWGLAYDNLEIQAIKSIEELFDERLGEALEEFYISGTGHLCRKEKGKPAMVVCDIEEVLDEIRKRWQEGKENV